MKKSKRKKPIKQPKTINVRELYIRASRPEYRRIVKRINADMYASGLVYITEQSCDTDTRSGR